MDLVPPLPPLQAGWSPEAQRIEAELRTIDDAGMLGHRLTQFLGEVGLFEEWLVEGRRRLLRHLRADLGYSYDQVAVALGVSKSRAQQLCRSMPKGAKPEERDARSPGSPR